MKKILSILSAGLLAIFAVSCVQEQLAMYDASKASAPVLQSFTVTDDDVTIDFTPGSFGQDFNQKMPVNHSVILKSVDGNAVETVIPSTVKDGKIVISVTNLSKTLMGMGYAEGQVVSLEMAIRASMQEVARDNRRNGFTESAGTISIPNYEIYIPTGDPYGRYTEKSPWGLVGSFNDWGGSPDVEMWTNGTLHVVKGVTLEAGTEVKFRKDSSWDVNLGYADGVSSYTLGEEFALAPGGANIVIAETGRYDMIIDVEGQTCKIIESVAGQEDPYAAYKVTASDDNATGIETGGISGGTGNNVQMIQVDYPMRTFYLYQQVYDQDGKPINGVYVDRNNDGQINADDKYMGHHADADFTFGFNTSFNYKNWTAALSGHASIGNWVYNNVASDTEMLADLWTNQFVSNRVSSAPKSMFTQAQYLSDYYLQDGSFLKLDNFTLGYTFPHVFKGQDREGTSGPSS